MLFKPICGATVNFVGDLLGLWSLVSFLVGPGSVKGGGDSVSECSETAMLLPGPG